MARTKHSMEYYQKKYDEIKQYTIDKGIVNPYDNLTQFISDYEALKDEGSKNVMREMKYYTQYETSYRTARGMLAKVKEFGGEEKFKDLKNMSTRAFADKYLDELKAFQKETNKRFREDPSSLDGKTPEEWVGIWWFGS